MEDRPNSSDRVRLAVITGAHGIKGWVKIRSFAEDASLLFTVPLTDAKGNPVALAPRGVVGSHLLASIETVRDRNAAEALRGLELLADASALPTSDEDGFRYDDLIGLAVVTTAGEPYGSVIGMYDFGAGDVVEIGRDGQKPEMYTFDERTFPSVDFAGRRLVIDPPDILSGKQP